MSKLSWYWHRLRAMTPLEIALHARKKFRQSADARGGRVGRTGPLTASAVFPQLPKPENAPPVLRAALKRDVEDILAGRWKAFGHLEIKVDDPPKWHCDYLVGQDLETRESAFKLNHRELPGGADIKLIWELSRWNQLVRLAMAAWVLGDERAGEKCLEWLEDWVRHNPPYTGWNWTSALEVGIRLIQFTWIDALLSRSSRRDEAHPIADCGLRIAELDQSVLTSTLRSAATEDGSAAAMESRLSALREAILPAHVGYAWRHRSFGSSANNHLLGELAGLIVATVRWPALAPRGTSLDSLQGRWGQEVLAQFAEDGGNKEQALNYHLFSWEFCWHARAALLAAGRKIQPIVGQRIALAAEFFGRVQVEKDPWDYGDSDNGFVTPVFAEESSAGSEWWDWMRGLEGGASVGFWCGEPLIWRERAAELTGPSQRCFHQASGIFVARLNLWTVRWDLSSLGYLRTAAHGHLDALHVSIWFKGVAMIIDPGTGAYYVDPALRDWLASRGAHNGPCLVGAEFPKRLGPFLWSRPHAAPTYIDGGIEQDGWWSRAAIRTNGYEIRRSLIQWENESGWQVQDACIGPQGKPVDFTVRWQFAPGSWVKRLSDRIFTVRRGEAAITIGVDEHWAAVELVEPVAVGSERDGEWGGPRPFEGVVSPSFRKICRAPYLKLTARASDAAGVYRTSVGPAQG